jgi:membrane-bound lytic murein transglycosylase A
LDVMPKEKITMQTLEAHLRSLAPEKRQEFLNQNPSYVFFNRREGNSLTYLGTEVIAGRTVATDQKFFHKGTLAYLEYQKPLFSDATASEPREWTPSSRFVFDQDTGGAIRGPGRLDLYWGKGDEAKQTAGVMQKPGRLYYLVPTPELLARLRTQIKILM